MGKVDVKAIAAANVPGSWGCIAVDIPKELIQQIQNTVNSFGGGVQGPLGTILNSVAGTAALTINPVATTPGDYLALAVTCTSPETASELGTMITSIPDFSKYNASTSGNILRICAAGGTASTSAPEFAKVLEGKTGGAVLDLDIFAKEAGINGSVGSLGKVVLYGESVDGGTKVKLTWKTDKPLTKVMKLVEVSGQLQNIARRIETSSDEFGEATYHNSYYDNSWDVPVDSVAVVDEDEPLTVYNPDYPY